MGAIVKINQISERIGANKLNYSGYTGQGVVVGIIDSGVNNSSLILEKSFISDNPRDVSGHGTAIADIITGIAPDVSLISAKIYERNSVDINTAMKAILWCAENGCNIINCSWGSRMHSDEFHKVIKLVRDKYGAICVFPTGNYGFGTLLCPAEDDYAVAVGSIPFNGSKYYISEFSGFGTNYNGHIKPDLVAYGGGMTECIETSVGCVKGTSFAVPVVVGAMALLYNSYSDKDVLVNAIVSNAKDVGVKGVDYYSGYGVLDVYNSSIKSASVDYKPIENKNLKRNAVILGLSLLGAYILFSD